MRSDGVTEEWVHPIQPSRPDRPTVRQRTRAERPFWGDTAEGRWRLTSSMNGRPIAISWMENTGGIREAARLACRILVSTPQRLRGAELFICVPLLYVALGLGGGPSPVPPTLVITSSVSPATSGPGSLPKALYGPLLGPRSAKIKESKRIFVFLRVHFLPFCFQLL